MANQPIILSVYLPVGKKCLKDSKLLFGPEKKTKSQVQIMVLDCFSLDNFVFAFLHAI